MKLPRLTVVQDKYAVGSVLGEAGPFEITYKGWHLDTEEQVLIKEYFPVFLADREEDSATVSVPEGKKRELFDYGQELYRAEARALQQIDHPNLLTELERLETNGTVYRVFRREASTSLAAGLKKQGDSLPERAARAIIVPVMDALEAMHAADVLHEGLHPGAILLDQEGQVKLFDFRATFIAVAARIGAVSKALLPAYAPPEQYVKKSKQGPWTDVYALGATLYRILSGQEVAGAKERLKNDPVPDAIDALAVSEEMKTAMKAALRLDPSKRPRSIAALRELLDAGATEEAESAEMVADEVVAPVADDAELPAPAQEPQEEADDDATRKETSAPVTDGATAPESGDADIEDQEAAAAEEETANEPDPAAESQASKETKAPAEPKVAAEPKAAEEAKKSGPAKKSAGIREASKPASDAAPSGRKQAAPKPAATEKKRTPVFAIGGVGALLVISLIGWFAFGGSSEKVSPAATLIQEADSLYEMQQFARAEQTYATALKVDPNNEQLKERLTTARQKVAAQQEQEYLDGLAAGDALLARGDSLMEAGSRAEAMAAYQEASTTFFEVRRNREDLGEDAEEAQSRVQLAMERMNNGNRQDEEQNPEQMQTQMFTFLANQGDQFYRDGEMQQALSKYEAALSIRTNDAIAQRVAEIRGNMEQEENDARFAEFMETARSAFRQGRFQDASRAYSEALAIRPNDEDAIAGMREVESTLSQKAKRDEQYRQLRARGDVLASEGDLEQAVATYREAAEYRPSDRYLRSQIEDLEAQLREQEMQEQMANSRLDEDGIYTAADQAPSISLRELHEQVRYPDRAFRNNVEGRVFVRAAVDESGQVMQASVVRGIGSGCDEEALRVVRESTFQPGRVDGEPVKAWTTVAIQFRKDGSTGTRR